MTEIYGLVRALREGDDAVKTAAALDLGDLLWDELDYPYEDLIVEAGGIPPLVELLRDGSAKAKKEAAWALGNLACNGVNVILIAEAGGIPPLIKLVRDGSADAKRAAAGALCNLARNNHNDDNQVLIAEAGGIPPLVHLMRDGSAEGKTMGTLALGSLAGNNNANAFAVATAVGLEALVELARRGRVTVDNKSAVYNAGVPAKRKAALVVAALLRDCVPVEARSRADVQDVIRGVIGPYL